MERLKRQGPISRGLRRCPRHTAHRRKLQMWKSIAPAAPPRRRSASDASPGRLPRGSCA